MLHEPRDPYGAALFALRRMMRQGRFVWGEPLVIKTLSAELRLSATPVREAMACLAGEGLIARFGGDESVILARSTALELEWTGPPCIEGPAGRRFQYFSLGRLDRDPPFP